MKYSAYGIELYKSGLLIAQVTNISGPSLGLDTVDVSSHDGAGWEEHIGTILRSGTVTLELLYDPALPSHTMLDVQMVSKLSDSFELRFPDAGFTAWLFDAFVTGLSPSAPVDGALTASVTLKPTGDMILDSVYSP